MNKQLRHISVVALILLAALLVSTTYWQTWAQADLAARKDNSVTNIERLTIDRGKIFAADGPVLAENRKPPKRGLPPYTSVHGEHAVAPPVIGYGEPAR